MTIKFNTVESIYRFCAMADQYDFDIDLSSGRYVVDAKSLLGIFSLALDKPVGVVIHNDDMFNDLKTRIGNLGISVMD